MKRSGHNDSGTGLASLWLMAVVMLAGPWVIGGSHPVAAMVLQLAWVVVLVVLIVTRPAGRQLVVPTFAWLPLGIAMVAALRPWLPFLATSPWEQSVFAIWDGLVSSGTVATGHASRCALVGVGVSAAIVALANGLRRSEGERFLSTAAVVTCVVFAVIGVAHEVVGAEKLYGMFSPRHVRVLRYPLAAPWVSENQAGTIWVLGAWWAIWRWRERMEWPALSVLPLGLTILVANFALSAHAAAAAGVASLAVFLLLLMTQRTQDAFRIVLGLAAVVIAVPAVLPWLSLFVDEAPDIRKLQYWIDSSAVAMHRPLIGLGAGAFPDAFTALNGINTPARYTHAESLPLQWAVEYGAVGASALWLSIAYWIWRRANAMARRSAMRATVWLAGATFVALDAATNLTVYATGYWPLAMCWLLLRAPQSRGSGPSESIAPAHLFVTLAVVAGLTLTVWPSVQLEVMTSPPRLSVGDVESANTTQDQRALLRLSASDEPGRRNLIADVGVASVRWGDMERADAVGRYLSTYHPGWSGTAEVLLATEGPTEEACGALRSIAATEQVAFTQLVLSTFSTPAAAAPCLAGAPEAEALALRAWTEPLEADQRVMVIMQVLTRWPQWSTANVVMAEALNEVEDPTAVTWAERAIERDGSARALRAAIRARATAGMDAEALALARELAEREPDCANYLVWMRALAASETTMTAAEVDLVVSRATSRCTAGADRGRLSSAGAALARSRGDISQERAWLLRWRRVSEDDPRALRALAGWESRHGQPELAEQLRAEAAAAAARRWQD